MVDTTIIITIRDSLATKAVRSPAGHSLSLESTTSSLSLLAPAGVSVSSQSGAVQVTALQDIKLRARGHNSQVNTILKRHKVQFIFQFKIDAGTIRLPRLIQHQTSHHAHKQYYANMEHAGGMKKIQEDQQAVYQLCLCR